MDYTGHGILQIRILEWVAFAFSRGSSQPRDWTQVSHIAGRFFTIWGTKEAWEIKDWINKSMNGEKRKISHAKRITNNVCQYSVLKGVQHELPLLLSVGCTKRTIWKGWGRVTFQKTWQRPTQKDEQSQHVHLSGMVTAGALTEGGEGGPWPLWSFSPEPTVWVSSWEKHQSDLNWKGPLYQIFHQYPSKLSGSSKTRAVWENVTAKKSLRRHGN